MPFINISVTGPALSATQKQRLFEETTRLMRNVMGKNPELTAVRIDECGSSNWAINARSAASRGEAAAYMDIKITEGTNTYDEKAEMIAQATAMLKEVVGNLTEASYIVIHDLAATTWGYDGRTQHARFTAKV